MASRSTSTICSRGQVRATARREQLGGESGAASSVVMRIGELLIDHSLHR